MTPELSQKAVEAASRRVLAMGRDGFGLEGPKVWRPRAELPGSRGTALPGAFQGRNTAYFTESRWLQVLFLPFSQDKSRLVDVRPHPEWLKVPAHGTRRELLASRRQELMPDISMDVDGDGVVGPTDYFVAKTFGKDNRLTTPERGPRLLSFTTQGTIGILGVTSNYLHSRAASPTFGAISCLRSSSFGSCLV